MWKKTIAVAGVSAAIVGGVATAALAASGTTTPTPSAPTSSTASDSTVSDSTASDDSATSLVSDSTATGSTTRNGKHGAANRLRKAVHATWVSENKQTKAFTTHDAIRGRVTAVSAASITVQAADNVTQTYVLTPTTKVHTRANKSGASISEVKTGDPVFVGGTGTTTLTAVRVVDTKK